jgi:hypothetical protein
VELPFDVPDDEITVFLHPDGPLGLLPLPGKRRYRMLVMLNPGEERDPTLESFQSVMKQRGPEKAVVSDPVWTVGFRIHARLAPGIRKSRVFLAGDAAHIHSPAGGQGMNMGMQDAYNLAWKLALVHKGVAKPIVLDSYEAERQPIHRATLEATDAATRRGNLVFRLKNRLAVEIRNQLIAFVASLGFVQEAVTRGISMLDIAYDESPIVRQSRPSVLTTEVLRNPSREAPCLSDWMYFGEGPGPGKRALDVPVELTGPDTNGPQSVFDLFAGTQHTLLLFDGAAATAEGYANLQRIVDSVKTRCGEHVRAHIFVPHAERPPVLRKDLSVLLDPQGSVHKRYGARSESLYLVRPDKHVAFRSQPADHDALMAYLDVLFR